MDTFFLKWSQNVFCVGWYDVAFMDKKGLKNDGTITLKFNNNVTYIFLEFFYEEKEIRIIVIKGHDILVYFPIFF